MGKALTGKVSCTRTGLCMSYNFFHRIGPSIGLLLIAVGTGGIKSSVAPFGADQFAPGQEKEQQSFFSAFYFMINLGSTISMIVTPILRGMCLL